MKLQSLSAIMMLVAIISFTACRERGCTDKMATNYNPQAKLDDRSCRYTAGCVDCIATNYDTAAVTNDGSCVYNTIDQIGTYTVIDSIVDKYQIATYDTFDISIRRDLCGAYNVLLSNYANLKFSNGSAIEVSAQILNDTIYILPQELEGPTDTSMADFYSIEYKFGYFRNDSIFLPILYTNRVDPFYGFLSGGLK